VAGWNRFLQRFNGINSWFFSRLGPPRSDHYVGQSKERVELMPVLRESPTPHFPVSKKILHEVEGMFHIRRTEALAFSMALITSFSAPSASALNAPRFRAICQ
jgi:hypothetical protein